MKEFFCRLFTPWRAGAQFDAPEAFYGFLLARNKLLGIIRNLCFGAALVLLTVAVMLNLKRSKYGRAIINNSKNKIILNLEPDEARYVQETLKLTRTEIRAITRFERGEALISSNNNKVPVVVKASKLEKEMITTDRAELEAILKERQREKTHSA